MTGKWQDAAACRDHPDPDIFFTTDKDMAAKGLTRQQVDARRKTAVRTCASCPVKAHCAAEGKREHNLEYGIWGGQGPTVRGCRDYRTFLVEIRFYRREAVIKRRALADANPSVYSWPECHIETWESYYEGRTA